MPKPNERIKLTDEQLDDLDEQEFLEYLDTIGAMGEDGTIDLAKIKHQPAQTFEELEALLWENGDAHTNG